MSKIGRKPISCTGVNVTIKGNEVHYKGSKVSGVYVLPPELKAVMQGENLLHNNEQRINVNATEFGVCIELFFQMQLGVQLHLLKK